MYLKINKKVVTTDQDELQLFKNIFMYNVSLYDERKKSKQ